MTRTTDRNHGSKPIVEAFMKAFSSGDIDAAFSYLSESATWWVAGGIEGISGTNSRDALRHTLEAIASLSKTGAIVLAPSAWTIEDERIAVEANAYAELRDGRVYDNSYHFVFVVVGGYIQEVKAYLDTEHLRSVFGTGGKSGTERQRNVELTVFPA